VSELVYKFKILSFVSGDIIRLNLSLGNLLA